MRPTAQSAVQALGKADLPELYRFWNGNPKASEPSTQKQLRADVLEWMGDPEVVGSRIADLGRRMGGIYDVLLGATRYTATFDELAVSRSIAYLSTYDLEAGLTWIASTTIPHAPSAPRPVVCARCTRRTRASPPAWPASSDCPTDFAR